MVAVYGGWWFENLVAQDQHFELQCRLFERGMIQGIQMRVAHPSYTPGVAADDLPRVVARLPKGMPVFIHFGAENCGVDFGERLDECGVFLARGGDRSWSVWNRETIAWGRRVASAIRGPVGCPSGVVHAGYVFTEDIANAAAHVAGPLRVLDDGTTIAVENVPAIVHCDWYKALAGINPSWGRALYWGVGGTPADMRALLTALGPRWRTLIDFTHLVVTRNQASHAWGPFTPYVGERYSAIERIVRDTLDLPHWPICHFSGIPPTLLDSSDSMDAPVVEPIRDALRAMDIVCLEIPFRPWSAERIIADFRKRYLDGLVTA
ncbi:hypothetical protein HY480_04395 [Candidatus Uhrbacteria bacterium]|nr:hypothetical protein [Candidatus Uhrbacteria bacterium]